MLVTTGGASVGEHDLVQSVLGDIGLEVDFWRIAMRPGKPLIFGHMGDTLLLGLPGNPVSAMVCAIIFLAPALHAMQGIRGDRQPLVTAILAAELDGNDERQDYLRATLAHGEDGTLLASVLQKQDSSVFSGLAHADCLVVRAPFAPPAAAGQVVTIIPLSGGLIGI
jgi:molybdopterin molybdotransferase